MRISHIVAAATTLWRKRWTWQEVRILFHCNRGLNSSLHLSQERFCLGSRRPSGRLKSLRSIRTWSLTTRQRSNTINMASLSMEIRCPSKSLERKTISSNRSIWRFVNSFNQRPKMNTRTTETNKIQNLFPMSSTKKCSNKLTMMLPGKFSMKSMSKTKSSKSLT